MKLFERDLGEGIRFFSIPKDIFKTDSLMLFFHTPLERETAVCRAMLPPVLGRGCAEYPDIGVLSAHLDELYCANAGCRTTRDGEVQLLLFSAKALETECIPEGTDVFLGTLETLAALMLHPLTRDGGFLPSYVETEKNNAIDAIRSRISYKEVYAMTRCTEEMCAEEPYGQCTYQVEDVERVTPKALYETYLDVLVHAPIDIYYVGKRDPETLITAVRSIFGELWEHRAHVLWQPQTTVLRRAMHPLRRVTEEQPARQAKLVIGFRTGAVLGDGDYYVTVLFNELFGASPTSRLFLQVREAMSLCYDCSSTLNSVKGLLFVACGIHPDRRAEAEEAIFAQLASIAAGEITDEEFEDAKRSLCTGYRMLEDSAADLCSWYHVRGMCGIDTSPDEAAAQVMGVTKAQLAAAAARVTPDTVYFMDATCAQDEEYEDDEEGYYNGEL